MLVSIGGLLNTSLKFLGLLQILQKYIPFAFYDDFVEAFETLNKALTSTPIVQPPDWNLPFEIV